MAEVHVDPSSYYSGSRRLAHPRFFYPNHFRDFRTRGTAGPARATENPPFLSSRLALLSGNCWRRASPRAVHHTTESTKKKKRLVRASVPSVTICNAYPGHLFRHAEVVGKHELRDGVGQVGVIHEEGVGRSALLRHNSRHAHSLI